MRSWKCLSARTTSGGAAVIVVVVAIATGFVVATGLVIATGFVVATGIVVATGLVIATGLARATGRPLCQDKQAVEMLAKGYRRWFAKGMVEDPELNEARLSIAEMPEGSVCYENPIGTAPAVRLKVDGTIIFLLPGVPAELQRLFTLYVAPALSNEGPGILKKAIHVEWPRGDESALKRTLTDIGRRYPGVSSRARVQGDDEVSIRISLFGEHADEAELDQMLEKAEADLRARLGLELPTRADQSE